MKSQIRHLHRVYMKLCCLFIAVNFITEIIMFFVKKNYSMLEQSEPEYLMKHLVISTSLSLSIVLVAFLLMHQYQSNNKICSYIVIITLAALITAVGAIHPTFSILTMLLLFPVFLSTGFGERELCNITLIVCLFGETIILLSRWYDAMQSGRADNLFLPEACLTYVILLAGSFAAQAMLVSVRDIQDADYREREKAQIQNMNMQMVTTLVNTIEAKDPYTNGHSNRVAMYAREIAIKAGKDEDYLNRLYYMSILHDIGKIGIPDRILKKHYDLTESEQSVIRTHPLVGAEILADITQMPGIEIGAKSHHEHYDGTGYPEALSGEDIPEEARIIAVADAYDAMTSERCYRMSYTQEQVREEIRRGRGTQFDPYFADIMIDLIDKDHDFSMHGSDMDDLYGIVQLRALLGREEERNGALQTSSAGFEEIYHFLRRYSRRNGCEVQLVLITMSNDNIMPGEVWFHEEWMEKLSETVKKCVRQTDVSCQLGMSQYMVILTDTSTMNADIALLRVRNAWEKLEHNPGYTISFEVQDIGMDYTEGL